VAGTVQIEFATVVKMWRVCQGTGEKERRIKVNEVKTAQAGGKIAGKSRRTRPAELHGGISPAPF